MDIAFLYGPRDLDVVIINTRVGPKEATTSRSAKSTSLLYMPSVPVSPNMMHWK